MSLTVNRSNWQDYEICRGEKEEDCENGGYVIMRMPDGMIGIAQFGHCSCYDTFESLIGGGVDGYSSSGTIRMDWVGTPAEMLDMALNSRDPSMPKRTIEPDEFMGREINEAYRNYLKIAEGKQ